jgi:hypothetical protein
MEEQVLAGAITACREWSVLLEARKKEISVLVADLRHVSSEVEKLYEATLKKGGPK